MTSATMTLRLDNKLKKRLDKLATLSERTKSFLAAEAIKEYLDLHEWQMTEIKTAMTEADNLKLVDHANIVKYWENRRADSLDKRR